MDTKKNNYLIKEDIKEMRNISLIIIGSDVWSTLTNKDQISIKDLKIYIKNHSKLLLNLTNDFLSSEYEYYVSCSNLFILEIFHVIMKLKSKNFKIEDFDCINMDILRTQHHLLNNEEDMPLNLYIDIIDDFSFYLDSMELDNKNNSKCPQNDNILKNNKCNNTSKKDKKTLNENPNNINGNINGNINKSSKALNSCTEQSKNIPKNINDVDNNNNNDNDNNDNNNDNNDYESDIYRNRLNFLNIIKSICCDEYFFNVNHHFLGDKKSNKIRNYDDLLTSFDIFKMIFQSNKDFSEQRKIEKFLMVTLGERIYLNLYLIFHVFKNPEKIKIYPIAKSIATVCKSVDDCTICLKLLYEAAEINKLPVRFCYIKSWIFYQCCVVYLLRYICTKEQIYNNNCQSPHVGHDFFASFPQETLAPCYFYLNLIKDMRNYFVNISIYIREIKHLIHETKTAVKNNKFKINIPDIFI